MSRCGDCKLGCHEQGAFYCEENLGYEQCIDRLQDALYAIDRPQGKWVSNHDGYWICSECGLRILIYAKGNFCPNCGAEMRGKGDEM